MKKSPPNYFEEYIRSRCNSRDLTIEMLADLSGISRSTFYSLLKRDSNPKLSQLIRIAAILNIHHDVLIQFKWKSLASKPICTAKGIELPTRQHDCSALIDETVPDGSIIAAGCEFDKTWIIQNLGNQTWHNRFLECQNPPYHLELPQGLSSLDYYLCPIQNRIAIPTTYPNQQAILTVRFQAPKIAGSYISYWKMVDEQGNFFFPNQEQIGLSTLIVVKTLGST